MRRRRRCSGRCSAARAAGASPTSSREIGLVVIQERNDVVEVAAAVIQRPDGTFLLAQRPPGKVYAGYWEFPGGKAEPGEPAAQALARELHEELGIEVDTAYPWITRVFTYPHGTVRLRFFRVVSWKSEPHPREGQAIAWQRLGAEERRIFCQHAIGRAHRYGCKVMVKTPHPGADGIHFTAAELMQLPQKPDIGLVAASCHTSEELERAMQLELDFAELGPVREKAAAATLGWEGFAQIVRGTTIPVYAIGGLTRADLEDARRAGAHGVAMIR